MNTTYFDATVRCRELEAENAKLRASLKQAVHYADVSSMEEGMPESKQATRLTATWIGTDQRYAAEFDVRTARALLSDAFGETAHGSKEG